MACHDFVNLLESEEYCDCYLEFNSELVPAHRFLLAQNAYFALLFKPPFGEEPKKHETNGKPIFCINDIPFSNETFRTVLRHFYHRRFNDQTQKCSHCGDTKCWCHRSETCGCKELDRENLAHCWEFADFLSASTLREHFASWLGTPNQVSEMIWDVEHLARGQVLSPSLATSSYATHLANFLQETLRGTVGMVGELRAAHPGHPLANLVAALYPKEFYKDELAKFAAPATSMNSSGYTIPLMGDQPIEMVMGVIANDCLANFYHSGRDFWRETTIKATYKSDWKEVTDVDVQLSERKREMLMNGYILVGVETNRVHFAAFSGDVMHPVVLKSSSTSGTMISGNRQVTLRTTLDGVCGTSKHESYRIVLAYLPFTSMGHRPEEGRRRSAKREQDCDGDDE